MTWSLKSILLWKSVPSFLTGKAACGNGLSVFENGRAPPEEDNSFCAMFKKWAKQLYGYLKRILHRLIFVLFLMNKKMTQKRAKCEIQRCFWVLVIQSSDPRLGVQPFFKAKEQQLMDLLYKATFIHPRTPKTQFKSFIISCLLRYVILTLTQRLHSEKTRTFCGKVPYLQLRWCQHSILLHIYPSHLLRLHC